MNAVAEAPLVSYDAGGGARVEVFDESRTYGYANLFQVRLRVCACFPGAGEPYERVLERLGVLQADVPRVRGELVEEFARNALPYLQRADFAQKHAAYRNRLQRGTIVPFPVRP